MRAPSVALVLLASVLTGCSDLVLDDGDPQTANTCVFQADDPHLSSHALAKSRRLINAEGWFRCGSAAPDVTLAVVLERQVGGGWERVSGNSTEFRPKPNRKYSVPVQGPCVDGVYRTSARITGHDTDGTPRESSWDRGRPVENPCDGKAR